MHILAKTALAAALIPLTWLAPPAASAQRGPQFMNSPGYQRALTESRRQLQRDEARTQPAAGPAKRLRRHPRR